MTDQTTIKLWRAVRVTPSKVPQTLADCDEGRLAVVRCDDGEWVIRKRIGEDALNSGGRIRGLPSSYSFVRYLDDPQPIVPLVPTTFGELRPGQCFRLDGDTSLHWRFERFRMILSRRGAISSGSIAADTPIIFINDIEMRLEDQP